MGAERTALPLLAKVETPGNATMLGDTGGREEPRRATCPLKLSGAT
jgi:hypothetical protein